MESAAGQSWTEQLKHPVNTLRRLERFIETTPGEREAIATLQTVWGTTPHFAALMDPRDPACPIRRQVIPSLAERENRYGRPDFLAWVEQGAEATPACILKAYPDRVVFLVSDRCASYCRHCFRRDLILCPGRRPRLEREEGLRWLREHTEIRDVLISGGDPFLLVDAEIDHLVRKLREIPHITLIRIGTRTPVVLPQRITPGLMKILRGYHRVPIWISLQCNHPREITEPMARAVYDLLSCGVSVGNQAVLLRGINDDAETFRELHRRLLTIRVRPYYLFYCDFAPGIDHFRTPLEKGAELIRDALQGQITGLAQPHYVVSTNIGKIPIQAREHRSRAGRTARTCRLRNAEGKTVTLPKIPD